MKSPTNPRDRLIVALDLPTAADANEMARELSGAVSFFKIGLQLYTAAGPEIVREIASSGAQIFLDLKLHDIPNTVAKAVAAAAELGVQMLTLHLSGGAEMISAAVASTRGGMMLLGVTVLTSSTAETLAEIGVHADVSGQVARLARLGVRCGIDGLITSPLEVEMLRRTVPASVELITPGVRPAWSATDDQKRFTTPRTALANGADRLVIGRPITAAADPRAAVERILAELADT